MPYLRQRPLSAGRTGTRAAFGLSKPERPDPANAEQVEWIAAAMWRDDHPEGTPAAEPDREAYRDRARRALAALAGEAMPAVPETLPLETRTTAGGDASRP